MSRSRAKDPLEAAARIVDDDRAGWSKVRWASWQLFEADQFEAARRGFVRLVTTGHADADVIAALQQLASDTGDDANIAVLIRRQLDERETELPPHERLGLLAALFDALATDSATPVRPDDALRFLEAAAACGPAGWRVVLEPNRRAAIEATLQKPAVALSVFEQFLYAPPETGLPAEARARIEEIGCRPPIDRDLARAAERLLHASGEPEAAYRVEACRRIAARQANATADPAAPETASPIRDLIVTIAGGHSALRSMARRDLAALGARSVREIPSAWEATRDGRAVQAAVAGSDVIVVITPQIAHSTSDQVRNAATRLGLPVVNAETASVAAIRRAAERAATPPDLPCRG